jgi:hypothetical protein
MSIVNSYSSYHTSSLCCSTDLGAVTYCLVSIIDLNRVYSSDLQDCDWVGSSHHKTSYSVDLVMDISPN